MSISSELLTLQNTKTAIRTAINNKGGSVGASDTFASYATAIDNLPSGGDNSTLIDLIERDITSITIPSGTTKIGQWAFGGCTSLTSVTIPNSVTIIYSNAFSNCQQLVSITIPESVTYMQSSVFMGCTRLTSVNIPSGLTILQTETFYDCSSLTGIEIPSSVTSIGDSALRNCTSLTNVTIPSSVTSIGQRAFQGCTSLTNVAIGDSITAIGSNAFNGCSSLTSVIVNAVTPPTLGSNVFTNTNNCPIYVPSASVDAYKAANNWSSYASRIQAIPTPTPTYYAKFTSSDSTINGQTFTGTNGVIGKNDLDNIIGSSQQDSRKSVTAVELTNLVTEISEEVFFNCTGLTSLTIPDSVTQLGNYAFENCSGLTNIIIGSGVTSIGDYCFGQLSNWPTAPTSVTVKATTPPTAGTGIFDEETSGDSPANSNLVIYVPAASVAAYQAASGWSAYASRIQAIPS